MMVDREFEVTTEIIDDALDSCECGETDEDEPVVGEYDRGDCDDDDDD